MIANIELEIPSNPLTLVEPVNDPNRRLLKNFNRQIERIGNTKLFSLQGMKQKTFQAQADSLRHKLALLGACEGNILIVTCLPYGELLYRMGKVQCGKNVGVCACNLNDLRTERLPNTLYALVGVNDGSERRLMPPEKVDVDEELVSGIVEPDHALTAWAAIDMVFHYPNVLKQHGLIIGKTTLRNRATALWLQKGKPIFGSTNGEKFESSRSLQWGVPSYQTMVLP